MFEKDFYFHSNLMITVLSDRLYDHPKLTTSTVYLWASPKNSIECGKFHIQHWTMTDVTVILRDHQLQGHIASPLIYISYVSFWERLFTYHYWRNVLSPLLFRSKQVQFEEGCSIDLKLKKKNKWEIHTLFTKRTLMRLIVVVFVFWMFTFLN